MDIQKLKSASLSLVDMSAGFIGQVSTVLLRNVD